MSVNVKTRAVVPDRATQHELVSPRTDPDIARLGMFRGVGEGFWDDAVEGDLGGAGKPSGKGHLDVDGQIGAFRTSFRQEADRRYPAEIIQHRWPKFMGIPPQLLFHLVEQFFDPPHLLFLAFRQFPRDVGERQMHRHQELPGFVVHGIGNALDLFLQRFIELPQRRDGVLHSAVRHFKRREHLRQKIPGGGQHFLVARRSGRLREHPVERPMMQGGDFHEALFLRDGSPAQLAGASQRRLPAIPGVFPKRRAIFFFKRGQQLGLPFDCRLHARTPLSRTTKTSASSFPRQCRSKIRSAALCGDSSAERPSAKSPRTPSVTNTSVSPSATGSTAACSAGNCEPTTPPRSNSTSCTLPFCAPARSNAPCTLPTPAQVIMSCPWSMEARLSTTPRVARRPSWQRCSRAITGSSAPAFRIATAPFAALAASSPCPIPSIAATKIPLWLQQTTCWSPDSPCPGRTNFATPYSTNGTLIVSTSSPSQSSPGPVPR